MTPAKLEEGEYRELLRWQRRMIGAFVSLWVYVLIVIAAEVLIKPEPWIIQLAFVAVLVGVVANVFLQFSVRCPRCGYRLGFQSGLVVPDRCRRCGVTLRPSKEVG